MKWRQIRRFILALASVVLVAFLLGAWFVAGALVSSDNKTVGLPPTDLPIVTTAFDSESGSKIAAWYASTRKQHPYSGPNVVAHDPAVPADDSRATVILLHGIHGDRRELVDRARLFHRAGLCVLMIDLQAHGESPGPHITLGHLERLDVQAAVKYVRKTNPNHRVGVVGISLGGAAAVLGSPLEIDAMVIESVYPTITEAVNDRVKSQVGPLSHVLAPALLCQLQPRLGIKLSDLRPIDKIATVGCPILVASGDIDQHTTLAETQRLFDAAIAPKHLSVFKGAAHIDLLEHDPQHYAEEIVPFLEKHLISSPELRTNRSE